MVPTRVELATLALLAPRSNRLSYRTEPYNSCFLIATSIELRY